MIAAKRLGFELESDSLRWERVVRPGKEGLPLPEFLEKDLERKEMEERVGGGRHSSLLSIGWDKWAEEGVREKVQALLKREVRTGKLSQVDFGRVVRN